MLESSIKNGIVLDYLVKAHVKGFDFLKQKFDFTHVRLFQVYFMLTVMSISIVNRLSVGLALMILLLKFFLCLSLPSNFLSSKN